MKKTVCYTVSVILLLGLFSFVGFAENDAGKIADETEEKLFSLIDSDTKKALNGIGIDSLKLTGVYDISLKSIAEFYSDDLKTQLKSTAKTFFTILSVVIIMSVVAVLVDKNKNILALISVSSVAVFSVSSLSSIINAVISTMNISAGFMKAYIPVYAGIIAFSGNPGTAVSYNSVVMVIAELISAFVNDFAVSLLGAYFCLMIAFSLSETVNTARFINAFSKIINISLGFASTLFAGILSIKSVLSSSVDSVAVKGTRFLLSSLVPVVGSAISEAYSSLLGSINLIKGSVAVVGIAVILVLNLPVIVQALLTYFSFSALSVTSEILDSNELSVLFRGIAAGMKYLLLFAVFEVFVLVISTGIVLLVHSS